MKSSGLRAGGASSAIGVGDVGSPWLRGDFHYGWNWWDVNRCDLFLHTLWGLGTGELRSIYYFDGYGSTQHQSIDIGGSYTYIFDYGIELKIEYAFRVYAKNCPENTNLVVLRLVYPWGL